MSFYQRFNRTMHVPNSKFLSSVVGFILAFVIVTSAQIIINPIPFTPGGSGTITGGTCTDSVVTAISSAGAPTCTADISAASLSLGGITSPDLMVHITNANGLQAAVKFDQYSNDTTGTGFFARKARGTLVSPSQTLSGDAIIQTAGQTYQNTGGFSATNVLAINGVANENQTSTAHGSRWDIRTTPDGSTTLGTVMQIGNAVGGFKLTTIVAPAATGTRFICINTTGVISSSAAVCAGT